MGMLAYSTLRAFEKKPTNTLMLGRDHSCK